MNASFNPFRLVNTYGAFGTVSRDRATRSSSRARDARTTRRPGRRRWREYEFKGKPGDPRRLPPQVAPYHLRLDWLIWFIPLSPRYGGDWFVRFLVRLLEGDRPTLRLLRRNPFPDAPPAFVRARLFRYRYSTLAGAARDRRAGGSGRSRRSTCRRSAWPTSAGRAGAVMAARRRRPRRSTPSSSAAGRTASRPRSRSPGRVGRSRSSRRADGRRRIALGRADAARASSTTSAARSTSSAGPRRSSPRRPTSRPRPPLDRAAGGRSATRSTTGRRCWSAATSSETAAGLGRPTAMRTGACFDPLVDDCGDAAARPPRPVPRAALAAPGAAAGPVRPGRPPAGDARRAAVPRGPRPGAVRGAGRALDPAADRAGQRRRRARPARRRGTRRRLAVPRGRRRTPARGAGRGAASPRRVDRDRPAGRRARRPPAAPRRALRHGAAALAAIAGDRLPAGYRRRLERYRHGPGVFKLDLAIDGPIPWRAAGACRRRRRSTSAARSRRSPGPRLTSPPGGSRTGRSCC